jgi:hypothetical protein
MYSYKKKKVFAILFRFEFKIIILKTKLFII